MVFLMWFIFLSTSIFLYSLELSCKLSENHPFAVSGIFLSEQTRMKMNKTKQKKKNKWKKNLSLRTNRDFLNIFISSVD